MKLEIPGLGMLSAGNDMDRMRGTEIHVDRHNLTMVVHLTCNFPCRSNKAEPLVVRKEEKTGAGFEQVLLDSCWHPALIHFFWKFALIFGAVRIWVEPTRNTEVPPCIGEGDPRRLVVKLEIEEVFHDEPLEVEELLRNGAHARAQEIWRDIEANMREICSGKREAYERRNRPKVYVEQGKLFK